MSGASACAATSAPRRLNSSWVEKTKWIVGRSRQRVDQAARGLDDDRAAGAIVDRGSRDAFAGESNRTFGA